MDWYALPSAARVEIASLNLVGQRKTQWTLSVKYVILIMRANNKGEGGIMALVALAVSSVKDCPNWGARLALVGVFGAALFYGDGVITPAISVLSAIEGLEVATPLFDPYVIPLTLAILLGLFL